ncbi:alkaline phosphatase family protein [Crenothrix polyspora]|uniref:alkaline phosphatase family protein n=1 Tax=Crenothrix polyspora TaxID=360316 RepID=UPI0023503387|nr:alkaline phosphatase family protein [Crenothrix polyspora]
MRVTGDNTVTKPIISASPTNLLFGQQPVGQLAKKTVTLSNTGTGTLDIGALTFNSGNVDFKFVDTNDCNNAHLVQNASCQFTVAFNPTTAGLKDGYIDIPSNGATGRDLQIGLTGEGIAVDLSLSVTKSPRPLVAGQVGLYTFEIINIGRVPATGVSFKADAPAVLLPSSTATQKLPINCQNPTNSIVCNMGNIAPNATVKLELLLKTPAIKFGVQDSPSQKFSVTATESDSDKTNNQVTTFTQTYLAGKGLDWEFQAKRLAQETPTKALPGCAYKPIPGGPIAFNTTGTINTDGNPRVIGNAMPIDYVFVLMLENRSFDSYFGRFPEYLKKVRGKTAATDIRVKPFINEYSKDGVDVPGTPYDELSTSGEINAADADLSLNANTRRNAPYNPDEAGKAPTNKLQKHYWKHHSLAIQAENGGSGLCVSDTAHDWWAAHLQWDRGRMDGFYQSNHNYWEGGSAYVGKKDSLLLDGERAMLYYDDRDIPFYYWLADNFAIGDRYFSSLLGPTWVNRDYLYAGTSRGLTSNNSDNFYKTIGSDNPGQIGSTVVCSANEKECPSITAGSQKPDPAVQIYPTTGTKLNYIADLMKARSLKISYWLNDLEGNVSTLNGLQMPPKVGAWTGKDAVSDDNVRSLNKASYDMTYTNPNNVRIYGGMTFKSTNRPTTLRMSDPGFEFALKGEADTRKARNAIKPNQPAPYSHIAHVNLIDPKMLEDINGEDEHPPGVPAKGQALVHRVVAALMANPEVWKRSVLFITYDEHGGFYDHVEPPPACEPDNLRPKWTGRYGGKPTALRQVCLASDGSPIDKCNTIDSSDPNYGGGFNRYGVRVPLMVVSPWAKHNHVSHQTYDHTSILRFIEARFGLPALTDRDANADPMLDFFDFTNSANKLTGKVSTWGKEVLPSKYPNQNPNGGVTNADILNSTVPDICKATTWFSPDGTHFGNSVYPARDWSDGIAPPASYLSDKSTKGIAEANVRR